MSKLSEDNVKLFYKLMHALLYYANKEYNIIKNIATKEEFFNRDIQETVPLRDKIYKNPNIFDDFVKENPENFDKEDQDIILSWKKFKKGEFFLAKHTKDHSILYSEKEKKAYGVLGISDSFEEMLGNHIPIIMKIVLLPFKEKITYEGIFIPYNIHFGAGIRKNIKLESNAAIQKYGVISSLTSEVYEKRVSDEEMLRFYMASESSMDRYWEEIDSLKDSSKEMETVYHQELARHSARAIKKCLKGDGAKGHFAVLGESVVASGTDNKKLDNNLSGIVPLEKMGWIYKFKI
jgi:hypothetical protein